MSSNETSRGLRCIFKQSLRFFALGACLGSFTGVLCAEEAQDVKSPPSPQTTSADPKSEEARKILEKANETMANLKTFKAEILNTSETSKIKSKTTCYQRYNQDGTVDFRRETENGDKEKPYIWINNNQGTWEIRNGTVLKLEFPQTIAASVQKEVISSGIEENLKRQYKLSYATLNGKECFVVKESISPQMVEKLEQVSPEESSLKTKDSLISMLEVYYIGRDDYFIYSHESFTTKGDRIHSTTYVNVKIGMPLADDLFRIPKGLKIKIIETIDQYADFITGDAK